MRTSPGVVSPTSACVFQKSASLELFTSQLMTNTSGRQRMFRVCTCRERRRWKSEAPSRIWDISQQFQSFLPSLLHSWGHCQDNKLLLQLLEGGLFLPAESSSLREEFTEPRKYPRAASWARN